MSPFKETKRPANTFRIAYAFQPSPEQEFMFTELGVDLQRRQGNTAEFGQIILSPDSKRAIQDLDKADVKLLICSLANHSLETVVSIAEARPQMKIVLISSDPVEIFSDTLNIHVLTDEIPTAHQIADILVPGFQEPTVIGHWTPEQLAEFRRQRDAARNKPPA